MHKKSIHLLIVSYYYPPLGGGTVPRVTRISKYLSKYDIQTTILTVSENYIYSPHRDDSLLPTINFNNKSINIIRTVSWEPSNSLRENLREMSSMKTPKLFSLGFFRNIFKHFLLPDEKILWCVPALLTSIKYAKHHKPDVLFVTSPPHSSLVIGTFIAKLLKIPLIAEFRDNWIGNPLFQKKFPFDKIESLMEGFVINSAATSIFVTESGKNQCEIRYPHINKDRFKVIYNSFDPDDFVRFHQIDSKLESFLNNNFVIVHTGGLDDKRNPIELFLSIQKLVDEHPDNSIHFLQIGQVVDNIIHYANSTMNKNAFKRLHFIPYMSHQSCLSCLKHAALQVLIPNSNAPTAIPGKVYEYINIGKPILILGNNHSVKEVTAGLDNCYQVPMRHEDINAFLHEFYYQKSASHVNATLPINQDFAEKYSAHNMAYELSEVIKSMYCNIRQK